MRRLLARSVEAAQPQGVRHDEDARERHRGGGDDRVQQPGDGERDRGDVVGERPEEVALDRGERAAREPDRVGGRAQVAGDEREVGRLDRDVRAGADREAEVGLRERGRVVDAVADHRDDLAGVLEPPHLGGLARSGAPRRARARSRPRPRRARPSRALSPVSRTGVRPSSRSSRDRLGARRLDGVGDRRASRARAVPARR